MCFLGKKKQKVSQELHFLMENQLIPIKRNEPG